MENQEHKPTLGIIGLGLMGGNLAHQALDKGMQVVGFTVGEPPAELVQAGLVSIESVAGFREHLPTPRAIFLYVPAGTVIDSIIADLLPHLERGDIIVDGGNSYWGDSLRRYQQLQEQGIHFVDLGTSGGVSGARNGACFMAGGDREAVAQIAPLLRVLAVEGGYVYTGPAGSGHYVKLVHNGIEFGMLQAIGEGMDLLAHYPDQLAIADILHCWRNGSVIRSWLMDLMEEVYRDKGGMEPIPPYIEDTGEVNWLVTDALHMEVPIPVIAQSVMQLFTSRDEQKNWARAVAMMRHGFGGHPFGKEESFAKKRGKQRVGEYVRLDSEHRE
jgi:6-phosphogluconate dehydrogenase